MEALSSAETGPVEPVFVQYLLNLFAAFDAAGKHAAWNRCPHTVTRRSVG